MPTRQGLVYKVFAGPEPCVFLPISLQPNQGERTMKPHLAASIGLDWADAHHDVSLQESGSDTVERRRIAHTPEALKEWVAELRHRFGGRPVGLCVELSRGPLIHALLEYEFLVLFPVNPLSLKRFRDTFATSGAKDDPTDADLLLELLTKHRDRLRAWTPDDPKTRALGRLVQARRKTVDLRTRLTQQLRAELKGYFPQALDWTGKLTNQLACDFLLRWPTLHSVQRARPETVRKFYYGHNCRRGDLIAKRLQEIRAAVPLTTDPAIVETSVLTVQMLARQIRLLGPSIARFEEEIDKLLADHPDAELFSSLPGAGPALAPRLLVAFGSNRERFDDAIEVQQYSGIAPVTERSGKKTWVHWRWAAPTFLRQSFHEFAGFSILYSAWARAFYDLQRERGKGHHAALRALSFKWIRILFRCWQDRTPYDETHYLRALHKRGSPLIERLKLPVAA
jgi:transposase